MQSSFHTDYFDISFDTKQIEPLRAVIEKLPIPGWHLTLSEMQDLAAAVNACVDAMQAEQFSRDYDKETENGPS